MNTFLIKKAFFDGWDNLIGMVVQNLGYMGILMLALLALSLPEGMGLLSFLLVMGASFLLSCYTAGVDSVAYGYARYERTGWNGFKRGISTSMRHVVLDWVLNCLLSALYLFVMPFYAAYRNFFSLIILVVLFWFSVFLMIARQLYWPLHYIMEGDRPTKTLKKCFIIMFDNMGRTLFMTLYSLVCLAISLFTVGLLPGSAGIELLHQDFTKLIMLKYDYLEQHPGSDRKHLPWVDLLYDDNESIGPRSFKSMIFPWKY